MRWPKKVRRIPVKALAQSPSIQTWRKATQQTRNRQQQRKRAYQPRFQPYPYVFPAVHYLPRRLTVNSGLRCYAYVCVSPYSRCKRTKSIYQCRNFVYPRLVSLNLSLHLLNQVQNEPMSNHRDFFRHPISRPLSALTNGRNSPRCFRHHRAQEHVAQPKSPIATPFQRHCYRCRKSNNLINSVVHPIAMTEIQRIWSWKMAVWAAAPSREMQLTACLD